MADRSPAVGRPAGAGPTAWLAAGPFGPTLERVLAGIGLAAILFGSMPDLAVAHDAAFTRICLAVSVLFGVHCALLVLHGPAARRLRHALKGAALVDALSAVPIPLALALGAPHDSARLLGIVWSLQFIRLNPAFGLIGRVFRRERQALAGVTTAAFVVILFAATLAFLAERSRQPDAFGSIPDALWWAMTTVTTTGYGDKVPATLAGRLLATLLMVSGIGLFALWAGILSGGFARELRRRELLQSWELVARLPLFRDLGAITVSEVARRLKVQRCAARSVVVRQGQPGDSMYFIAEGEVEVLLGAGLVRLGPGEFFGEMALVTGAPRSATVVALSPVTLLRLDVVDFRDLAAHQPELHRIVEQESTRRGA
jgi:voltage-gated potassium channel